jgi:signal transduction histidine kinase
MTYPPAFGTAQAVLAAREVRLLLHGAAVLLSLLGGALAACFGLKGDRRRGFLLVLVCLCCAVLTGYPLLHALTVTGYQPWYTLELSALYAFLLLAVALQCRLYGIRGRTAAKLTIPCGLGLAAAAVRSLSAAWWSSPALSRAFSVLTDLWKYYAAACLIALAAWALGRRRPASGLLLGASVSLGTCLVMDRILPLYEPVYGGWFEEIGAILLAAALAAELWLDAMDAYRFRLTFAEQVRQMEHQVSLQKEHYRQLTEQIELARQSAHDLRHHMRVLRAMAEQGEDARLLDYLNEYEEHAVGREVAVYSKNPTADAILAHYAAAAKAGGIRCELGFSLPPELDFPDVELSILLGNLLENAVESLAREPEGKRTLRLRGDAADGRLRLVVENSFTGALQERGGVFVSTKHAGLGVGVRAVRTVVEKYGGLADFSADGAVFRAQLMIPLPRRSEND